VCGGGEEWQGGPGSGVRRAGARRAVHKHGVRGRGGGRAPAVGSGIAAGGGALPRPTHVGRQPHGAAQRVGVGRVADRRLRRLRGKGGRVPHLAQAAARARLGGDQRARACAGANHLGAAGRDGASARRGARRCGEADAQQRDQGGGRAGRGGGRHRGAGRRGCGVWEVGEVRRRGWGGAGARGSGARRPAPSAPARRVWPILHPGVGAPRVGGGVEEVAGRRHRRVRARSALRPRGAPAPPRPLPRAPAAPPRTWCWRSIPGP
jgi:hypothetical protein